MSPHKGLIVGFCFGLRPCGAVCHGGFAPVWALHCLNVIDAHFLSACVVAVSTGCTQSKHSQVSLLSEVSGLPSMALDSLVLQVLSP